MTATAAQALAEIEGRADGATAGPWTAAPDVHQGDYRDGPNCHSIRTGERRRAPGAQTVALTDYDEMGDHDAAFIAHARTDVPRMAEALRGVLALADAQLPDAPSEYAAGLAHGYAAAQLDIRTAITAALGCEAGK